MIVLPGQRKLVFTHYHVALALFLLVIPYKHFAIKHATVAAKTSSIASKAPAPNPKDVVAIKAMAGVYDVTFEFKEVAAFRAGYELAAPYRARAKEAVFVVEESPGFISLQHILMAGPYIIKHWRQDWRFGRGDQWRFVGKNTWLRDANAADNTWTQMVYQVDDSPRYSGSGAWEHSLGVSRWQAKTWRPLPRREKDKRSDYDVLVGSNTHTITASGWLHEQRNYKVPLDESKQAIAQEIGINTYQRISNDKGKKAAEYMQRTGAFWHLVRQWWQTFRETNASVRLRDSVDDKPLWQYLFAYAERINDENPLDPADANKFIRETMQRFVE